MDLCVCFLAVGMPLKEESSVFLGFLLGMAYEFLEREGVVYDAEWGQGADLVTVVAAAVVVAAAAAAGKDS